MGRVLLAALDEPELDRFLAHAELTPLTPKTLTAKSSLRREIHRVRTQGWALVDQELEDGLRSVAAPIHNGSGKVVAAINLSTHISRRTPQKIRAELLPPLLDAAGAIERDLAAGRIP
jgi:IclR family pca regulon transcriptional regulator